MELTEFSFFLVNALALTPLCLTNCKYDALKKVEKRCGVSYYSRMACSQSWLKDEDRREGEGRRCWSGD